MLFYRLIKILEYETANPGADSDGVEHHHTRYTSEADEEGHASKFTGLLSLTQN